MQLRTLKTIILAITFTLMFVIWFFTKDDYRKRVESYRRQTWNYVVESKFKGGSKHATQYIIVLDKMNKNKKDTVWIDPYADLYTYTLPGDSLYKAPGILKITLYRKGDTTTESFDPYDGKELIK